MAARKPAKQDGSLLIVEDDSGLQKQLRWSFEDYEVAVADDQGSALAQLAKMQPKVVLLDLGLPPDPDGPSAGLAILQAILQAAPTTKVIMMSGQTDRAYALKAIALGAYDFYQKPIKVEEIQLIVSRALRLHRLEAENRQLVGVRGGEALPGFITTHPELLQLCDELKRLATTDITVLLTGESGTGKEVLAQALHELSPRRKGPLIAVNCAAIPETLLESELFGHEKGAFTGAIKTTVGKVEQAEGGTFFLDEVGDMPVALQAKLLRFLQERRVERVGGRNSIPVDVRVIAATNQNLEELIADGRFRQDFYYRLSESEFLLPPLRERPEDAVLIAHRLVRRYAEELKRPVRGFSTDALAAILGHRWTGNVRELQNCIKRAVAASRGSYLTPTDLRLDMPKDELDEPIDLATVRTAAEGRALRRAQAIANGNRSEMARLLGVSRPTLYQLLKQHDLEHEAKQETD
ncbi:MAG: PEP-CTERM-box response regulator transcription factor [Kiloniellaceae bacterium]